MKGSRRLIGDFDDGFPVRSPSTSNFKHSATRSQTMSNLRAAAFDSGDSCDEEEEEQCDYSFSDYEEEWDDEQDLDDCFSQVEKKFDISKCDKREMIRCLREIQYDTEEFILYLKQNRFGPCQARKAKAAQQQIRAKSQPLPKFKETKQKEQDYEPKIPLERVMEEMNNKKKHANLVIVGHVDAGKSTLMGHLLYFAGKVNSREIDNLKEEAESIGKGKDFWAWVMAQDDSERSHGVTIDVSMVEFETEHLNLTVLDAPGHRDFVPNMIAGASQADAALLVVDAGNLLIERGQAREHLLLCRSLGVTSVIIAINKMDTLEYSQASYDDAVKRMTALIQSIGMKAMAFIPISASNGDNLKERSQEMDWYTGPTILEAIDSIQPPKYDISSDFLMCASEVIETTSELIVSGRVECGYICTGDSIKILPVDQIETVSSIRILGEAVPYAVAGAIAEVTFKTNLRYETVPVGSAIMNPRRTIKSAHQFVARILTFNIDSPLTIGKQLSFHRQALDIPARLVKINAIFDKKTKAPMKTVLPFISQNTSAEVVFRLNSDICMELDSVSKSFGRFVIRVSGKTLGCGQIINIIDDRQ